jgi:hypothetical protein
VAIRRRSPGRAKGPAGTIDRGFLKRHFWGELLRRQQTPARGLRDAAGAYWHMDWSLVLICKRDFPRIPFTATYRLWVGELSVSDLRSRVRIRASLGSRIWPETHQHGYPVSRVASTIRR